MLGLLFTLFAVGAKCSYDSVKHAHAAEHAELVTYYASTIRGKIDALNEHRMNLMKRYYNRGVADKDMPDQREHLLAKVGINKEMRAVDIELYGLQQQHDRQRGYGWEVRDYNEDIKYSKAWNHKDLMRRYDAEDEENLINIEIYDIRKRNEGKSTWLEGDFPRFWDLSRRKDELSRMCCGV